MARLCLLITHKSLMLCASTISHGIFNSHVISFSLTPVCVSMIVLTCVRACLLNPSLVQSFVGSHWIDRSRVALMSSMASCSMSIAFPMWSCWWATLTCTATCCPSTMMTTTIKPSPLPALYSGCSCRGKVSTEEVFKILVLIYLFDHLFLFPTKALLVSNSSA